MEEMRNAYKILVRRPEGRRQPGKSGVVGRALLKCILK
jgi:hypothetical protein